MQRYRWINLFMLLLLLVPASLNHITNVKGSNLTTTSFNSSTFVSQWNTALISSGSSTGQQVKLPLESSGTYNFTVDWGDGINNTITSWDQADVTHTYASEDVYDIAIEGTLVGWRFNNGGDKLKIIEISQWGNIRLGNSDGYFYGSSNLHLTATDALNLTGTTTLYQAFRDCTNLGNSGNMNTWDVSSVIDMGGMFYSAFSFNQPIGDWNVSSVTRMNRMFDSTSFFNQPIGNWDVSSVTTMDWMFSYASDFNQSIGNWDVSSVIYIRGMFYRTFSFNQPIGNWNVSSVIYMNNMFRSTSFFNQPIGNWDVSSVTDMSRMFTGVTLSIANYDHLLSGWSTLPLQTDVTFHGGISRYTNAAAKQYIIDTFGWTIYDAGLNDFTPPDVNSADDFNYKLGSTGNEIVWVMDDLNTGMYNITIDGSLYVSDTLWNNGVIIVNVDGLEIGVHTFIIYVYDSNGNMASDTVIVTVTGIREDTEISTNTPDTNTLKANFLQFSLFLVSIVSIAIIQRLRKNRSIF